MPMRSMRVTPDGTLLGGPQEPLKPDFASGTRLELGEDAIKALGLGDLPEVGAIMKLEARVVVTGESENMVPGQGLQRHLSLQITDMDLGGSGSEKKEQAQLIYMEDN